MSDTAYDRTELPKPSGAPSSDPGHMPAYGRADARHTAKKYCQG